MRTDTLGEALKAELVARGKTAEQASTDAGLTGNKIGRWINGTDPKPDSYDFLCAFLHVDLEGLGGLILRARVERSRRR